MKTKIAKNATYWLGVVALGLVVGLSIQFVTAWTEPAAAPPGGNVGAPVNTSVNLQTKLGNFIAQNLGAYNLTLVEKGSSASTVAADPGTTLVTKDYVDAAGGGGGNIGTCYNKSDMLYIQFPGDQSCPSDFSRCTQQQIVDAGRKGCLPDPGQYLSHVYDTGESTAYGCVDRSDGAGGFFTLGGEILMATRIAEWHLREDTPAGDWHTCTRGTGFGWACCRWGS